MPIAEEPPYKHDQKRQDTCTLRELRAQSGMTQVEVAQAMHVSQNRVSQIENGDIDTMAVSSVRRYVEALGGKLVITIDLPEEERVLS